MQWLIYLLAKNLDSQEKLAERLRGLDTEQILHEPLLRGAIKESFRLYPIAHVITRILPEDALIEGYPVNKGVSELLMNIFTIKNKVGVPKTGNKFFVCWFLLFYRVHRSHIQINSPDPSKAHSFENMHKLLRGKIVHLTDTNRHRWWDAFFISGNGSHVLLLVEQGR